MTWLLSLHIAVATVSYASTHGTLTAEPQEQTDTVCTDTAIIDAAICDTVSTEDSLTVDTLAPKSDKELALPWPLSLQADIDSIIKKSDFLRSSQLGLMVYDLTADSVLYAHGERQTLRPASTMKVLTAVTALDKLGGAYLYKTRLRHTGSITDSIKTLHGDLYIIGGMDPRIGADDIRSFAFSVKECGIDTISGNLYADRSMKDSDMAGEGWCWDDDNPVLSPLLYGRKDRLADRLAQALEDAGVVLKGEKAQKTCPANAKELCTRTHTIEQVLHRMLKESDNLYAESMFYQLGLTKGKPATARKAKGVIEEVLRKTGLASRPHRFADGSGLSLYNYVSAEIEVAFLRYAYENKDIYAYLYPALPIAAVDGTLDKRMHKTAAARNVHAKTGTLSGISSLAGYCTAANGHELCFAIINQGVMRSAPAKTFQNKICVAMCR